jgi:hypothetical protein
MSLVAVMSVVNLWKPSESVSWLVFEGQVLLRFFVITVEKGNGRRAQGK